MATQDNGGAPDAAILVELLGTLELEESQPAVYDRPIRLRLLYEDPESGEEHYIVRYPPGLRGLRHRHSAAHTIIVLDGALLANGKTLPAGSYAHFPANVPMHHEPAPDHGCLFVIIFHAPYDVEALGDLED